MRMIGPLVLLVAAACGDGRAPSKPAPAAPAAAATPGTATPTRDEVLTFVMEGRWRRVLLHVPAGVAAREKGKKLALVLDLHPSAGTAAGHKEKSGLVAVADREGFAVAYPQGAIAHEGGFQWHVPGTPLVGGQPEPEGPDDVAFLAEVIERIDQAVGIDRARIYATGFSGGARMSSALGCALPELAGIAPISGVRAPEPCPRTGLSVIAFHGTADTTNAYDGPAGPYWTYGVREAMRRWAERDGCGAEAEVTRAGETVELRSYTGCGGGAKVLLYSLEGEAHERPRAVSAAELMWKAFATK